VMTVEVVVVVDALMVHVEEVATDVEEATIAIEMIGGVRCEAKNY